jgi:hypothetical protein
MKIITQINFGPFWSVIMPSYTNPKNKFFIGKALVLQELYIRG